MLADFLMSFYPSVEEDKHSGRGIDEPASGMVSVGEFVFLMFLFLKKVVDGLFSDIFLA